MKYRIRWKNTYWNGCGWTEYRKNAHIYPYSEAFEMVDEMLSSDIGAFMEPVRK